ncbi:hypothetical protein EVAR_88870_1 [Eumeta japonica]|uniref:Uncharacterized protein n=1 Tax=Eumeta variegata TaxID=151549 RepID=A0A4C1XW52_EUMVA|nr:hypothetical protein EVAR_88870_1 [Eumeta japonica]
MNISHVLVHEFMCIYYALAGWSGNRERRDERTKRKRGKEKVRSRSKIPISSKLRRKELRSKTVGYYDSHRPHPDKVRATPINAARARRLDDGHAGGGGRLAPCRCICKVSMVCWRPSTLMGHMHVYPLKFLHIKHSHSGGNDVPLTVHRRLGSHCKWAGITNGGRTSRKAHRSHEELGGATADQRETSATGGVLGEVLHRRDWHSARDLRHAPPHTPPRTRHCTHGGAGAPTPERSKRRELTADRAVSSIPDVSPRSTFYIGDATVPSSAAAPDDSRPASPTPASIQLVEYEDHDQGTRYLYSGRAIDGKAPDEEWRSVAESRGRLASEGDALSACARPASAAFSGVSIDIR